MKIIILQIVCVAELVGLCGIWDRGYKTFLCSTQLSMRFILLINVKTPTIVGILTFISMMNTSYERPNARHFYIFGILIFMSS